MKIKIGKNGPFLACSGYPECSFTQNYTRDEKGKIVATQPPEDVPTGETCDKCGSAMVQKQGRFPVVGDSSGGPDRPDGAGTTSSEEDDHD